jgi:hypothetical protein
MDKAVRYGFDGLLDDLLDRFLISETSHLEDLHLKGCDFHVVVDEIRLFVFLWCCHGEGLWGPGIRLVQVKSVVRGGDDDIDPDPLVRGSDGRSRPPSWGHEFPELCRGDRE